MLKALYILGEGPYERIYGPQERKDIDDLVDICAPPQTPETVAGEADLLAEMDVMFSGWGAPKLTEEFLAAAPKLRVVFYGAGSVRNVVTEASWDRGVRITSAYAANAVPVSEYTLSQILFCLKHGWRYVQQTKRDRRWGHPVPVPGAYRSTVGIISLGMIGRLVCELLKSFDLDVLAYDPYVDATDAANLGVQLVSLEELFKRCEVVSCHTPNLPETRGMLTGGHFASMKPDAAFINTARGAVVREQEMLDVLAERPDLTAVLDVTYPEPPAAESPIWTLENVIVTPHIAGSMDRECNRMGRYMVEELQRFLRDEPMRWEITREQTKIMA